MSYSTTFSITMTGTSGFPLLYPGALSTASSRVERDMLREAFCAGPGTADPTLVAAFDALHPDCAYGVDARAVMDMTTRTLRCDTSVMEISSSLLDDLEEFCGLLDRLIDEAGDTGTVTVYIGLS